VTAEPTKIPIFDLDGTLVDSDAALVAPFLALGVPRKEITFGHVLADECGRLGITVEDYLERYDIKAARPFAHVDAMLGQLTRWAVCSNKHPEPGHAELARLGWRPAVALFSDSFDGPKRLPPVIDALRVAPDEVVFVGDTSHDREVAARIGVPFGLAAWNRRAVAVDGDVVLRSPLDVIGFCRGDLSSP
jgi:HAD superfamily hydrolase (TIGR01549 family)